MSLSNLTGLIHINFPPGEFIAGADTNILYNKAGVIGGDNDFTYTYGTPNPTISIGAGATGTTGTLKLGGTTGSGIISGNTLAINSVAGISSNIGTGVWEHTGSSSTASPLVSFKTVNPVVEWNGTNNSTDMKRWQIYMDGSGNLYTTAVSDNGITAQQAIQITRSGTNVTSHRFFIGGNIIQTVTSGGTSVSGAINATTNIFAKTISAALNPANIAGPTNSGVTLMEAANYADIALYDATQTANARSFDIINFQNKVQFRLKNDSGSTVIVPISFNGGYAGYTGISSTGPWAHAGTHSVSGTATFTQAGTTPGTSTVLLSANDPQLDFYVANYLTGRRRWNIRGGGAFLATNLLSDDGTTSTAAYNVYNAGANSVGGHNWFVGTNNNVITLTPTGWTLGLQGVNSSQASAALEIQSTTQGFLPPQMTTAQMHAIPNPAQGLIVVNITTNQLAVRFGSAWYPITAGAPIAEEEETTTTSTTTTSTTTE